MEKICRRADIFCVTFVCRLGRSTTLSEPCDIEGIFRRHAKSVWRLCYSYLGSSADAEDATQAVFMKLLDRPRSFESEEHEKAWLIVCASNWCKDVLKSASRTRVTTLDDQEAPEFAADATAGIGIDPAEAALRHDDEVLAAVLRLPEVYKDVIYLYYYEGYKTDAIARMTDTPPSTVRNRLRDARRLLKQELGGELG